MIYPMLGTRAGLLTRPARRTAHRCQFRTGQLVIWRRFPVQSAASPRYLRFQLLLAHVQFQKTLLHIDEKACVHSESKWPNQRMSAKKFHLAQ